MQKSYRINCDPEEGFSTQDPSKIADIPLEAIIGHGILNLILESTNQKIAIPNRRRIMKFAMPQYEVKYHGEDGWQEISELKVIGELFKTFNIVTPAIQQMIEGKQVNTPEGVYRIKERSKFSEVYI